MSRMPLIFLAFLHVSDMALGEMNVTQDPTLNTTEGNISRISCHWNSKDGEQIRVEWRKYNSSTEEENGTELCSVRTEQRNYSEVRNNKITCNVANHTAQLTIEEVTEDDGGLYVCEVIMEIPRLKRARGGGTRLNVHKNEVLFADTAVQVRNCPEQEKIPIPNLCCSGQFLTRTEVSAESTVFMTTKGNSKQKNFLYKAADKYWKDWDFLKPLPQKSMAPYSAIVIFPILMALTAYFLCKRKKKKFKKIPQKRRKEHVELHQMHQDAAEAEADSNSSDSVTWALSTLYESFDYFAIRKPGDNAAAISTSNLARPETAEEPFLTAM